MTSVDQCVARGPDKPQDRRAIAIAFMFVSMGVMVATLVATLFFQGGWSYAVCVAIYALKIAAERRFGITSPLSISILLVYVALLGAGLAGIDSTGYAGVVTFAWLFGVVGVLLAIGKPFTTFYSGGLGLASVHRVVSILWLVTYAASLAASVWLMPDPLFVILPALFCVLGAVGTVFVSFFWCGKQHERRRSYAIDGFDFTQISPRSPEFKAFCDFYAKNIADDPHHAADARPWQVVAAAVSAAERALGSDSVIFVCKEGDRVVGSIRCALDRAGRKFPPEADMASSFDGLRSHGRLMLVGRLAIDEAYRARPAIMTGLFAAFVDLALEHDVSYVVSDGFRHVLPVYMKLGFEMMFDRRDRRHAVRMSHGFVTHPLLLNFENFVLTRARSEPVKFGLFDAANPYIAERWYKRAALRHFFDSLRGRAPLVDIEDIRAVLVEPGMDKPDVGASAA